MGASSWLAVERPLKLVDPKRLASALLATSSLWQFWLPIVGKWPAEQMMRSKSEPLVHFAECMVRGRSRASCKGVTILSIRRRAATAREICKAPRIKKLKCRMLGWSFIGYTEKRHKRIHVWGYLRGLARSPCLATKKLAITCFQAPARVEILRLKAFGQLSGCLRLVPPRRNGNTSARVDLQNA